MRNEGEYIMIHRGTKSLETKRLLLRQFKPTDAQNMFDNWASNSNVTRYLTWSPHDNVETTKSIVNEWVDGYNAANFYQWAIEVKELLQPIGSISVVRINEIADEVEVGYCIGEQWWHQGYTSEAFAKVIEFLFSEVGVKRICAKHDTDNPNSGRVMLKCGLEYEGTLRKAGKNSTNSVCDLAVYSILNY